VTLRQRYGRACAAAVDERPRAVGLALVVLAAAFIALLCCAAPARGTAGAVTWDKTWNTSRPGTVSSATAVAKPGGGVYVAASLLRPSGNIDISVLRFSSAGKRLWTRFYDGPSHGIDWMEGIAVDGRGNVVVCGATFSVSGKDDWVVLKYAPDGRRRWVRKLAGAYRRADIPEAIAVDRRGDVVVAGALTRKTTGGDWCVVKYSAAGTLLWRTTMTRSIRGLDQPLALAVDPADAHIYVTGRMYGSQSGDDTVTVRYRPNGRRVWSKRWTGTGGGPDHGGAIAVSPAGVAVAGVTTNPASGGDGLVLRYSKGGVLRWERVVDGGQGGSGVDRFAAVAIDSEGGVTVAGSLTTTAEHGQDVTVVRYGPSGIGAGHWSLEGAGHDEAALDVVVAATGRTYAAGTTAGATGPDVVVAGLSNVLLPLWPALLYDRGDRDDQAQSVSLTSGAMYVAGVSGSDLLVLKILR